MQWTALDLKNLAALFDDMADAILAFRKQNSNSLTQLQKDKLTWQFGELVKYGEDLENKAVGAALVDIDGSVKDLQNAAHDAIHALQVITDVQKAITIGVAAIGLGAALVNPTPGTVASSLGALTDAIKDATKKPADDGGTTSKG